MKPLPIVAASSFAQVASATPENLRERVKQLCPRVPRRVNRLVELGLIGAHQCVKARALLEDTAIYMAFTSGCVADSVALVQDVARGQMPMPVTFINVSSNMAGFYIAASLNLHSGNQVVASNDFAWEAALELAMLGAPRALLLGAVEEAAWPLNEHRSRMSLAPDEPILESSHWLLADHEEKSPLASVQWLRRFNNDSALDEFLRGQRWPENIELNVQNADAARLSKQLGLKLTEPGIAGYTGMAAAQACTRFVEKKSGGSLLHLNRGRGGAWYAMYLTTQI